MGIFVVVIGGSIVCVPVCVYVSVCVIHNEKCWFGNELLNFSPTLLKRMLREIKVNHFE